METGEYYKRIKYRCHRLPHISIATQEDQKGLKVLDSQIKEIVKQLNISDEIKITFSQGQCLQVEKQGNVAKITYGRRVELFRGLGLLAEHSADYSYTTTQQAYFTMNGAMLDCSRNGVVNLNAAKQMIRYMALMGHNMLMLYTEDTYEVPEYPYFGYMRGRYTQKQLQELDAYAQGYGIELIPCIQTLAHLSATLRWMCFDDVKDDADTLLIGEEKTYQLIEAMIRACRNSFTTDRIHIGMDEAFMMGFGRYRMKHGIPDREKIFCEHLYRVNEICQKYGFKPMIWSDMFYRLAVGAEGGEYTAGEISQEVMDLVPGNVDLVYWDYYKHDKDAYCTPMRSHKKFDNHIIFAGGSWRWAGFAPHIEMSLDASQKALMACKETGIREVFCTAWGDQGNECPMFSILPTLQLFAELSYNENVDREMLASRLHACTGEYWEDLMLMDNPNRPDGKYRQVEVNPSTYLLYADVLGNLYERHTEACYQEYYDQYASKLHKAALHSPSLGYAYDMLAKLCHVLSLKACVSADAYQAYQVGDRQTLRVIAEETMPEILERLEAFRASVEKRWLAEFNYSGYDVMDYRLGGVSARVKSAIRRLQAYLSGEIEKLDELEQDRLSFNCITDAQLQEDRIMSWNCRAHHVSANNL